MLQYLVDLHLFNSLVALKYSDIVGLERSIDTAYQIASQRLFDVFFDNVGGKILNLALTRMKIGARIALCGECEL